MPMTWGSVGHGTFSPTTTRSHTERETHTHTQAERETTHTSTHLRGAEPAVRVAWHHDTSYFTHTRCENGTSCSSPRVRPFAKQVEQNVPDSQWRRQHYRRATTSTPQQEQSSVSGNAQVGDAAVGQQPARTNQQGHEEVVSTPAVITHIPDNAKHDEAQPDEGSHAAVLAVGERFHDDDHHRHQYHAAHARCHATESTPHHNAA